MADDSWALPYPARVLELADDDDWSTLRNGYFKAAKLSERDQADTGRPFVRCLAVARENGAKSVVIETRYVDPDYRSEYAAFYSRSFATFPDVTHRLHFFSTVVSDENIWFLPEGAKYLGYVIIRPQNRCLVGRTVLKPPPSMVRHVRAVVSEPVTFFGQRLEVVGTPFVQQDTRLLRCAQAAAWVCCYSAFRRGDIARRNLADFSLHTNPSLAVGRPLPSGGLNLHQISELLRGFGLPPLHYPVKKLSHNDRPDWWPVEDKVDERRLTRVLCRYLNSGLPVLVTAKPSGAPSLETHAFVACGYYRDPQRGERSPVSLIVHDDRRGPYLAVPNVLKDVDESSAIELTWDQVLAPLPEKLWLSGEAAERSGCARLVRAADKAKERVPSAKLILDAFTEERLAFRTYAVTGSRFKLSVRRRFKDTTIVRNYSLARLSRYVWVVEAIDRKRRDEGQPCVLGEIIFDATSDDHRPTVLATRLPGVLAIPVPGDPNWDTATGTEMVESGAR